MQIKNKIKKLIKQYLYKRGLKTNRQIVVFESDDWGAERSFSAENLEKLKEKYPDFKPDNYQAFDVIETDEDVKRLKETILKHKDKNAKPVCFTLNFATKNLDYDAMRENDYKKVKLVSVDEYYKRAACSKKVLAEVADGEYKGCFVPQLHAREHVNASQLIKDVWGGDSFQLDALKLNIVGVKNSHYAGMDCLNVSSEESLISINEAMQEFKRIFGTTSESFIAPCYVWKKEDEKVLESCGVKFLQGNLYQNIPSKNGKYKKKIHKFGEKSSVSGLRYFFRNCHFEPSKDFMSGKTETAIVDDILSQIRFAFKCNKPAVICTHRVNWVGSINKENREHNLRVLDKVIWQIKLEFPNVEFMSTVEMAKEILKENA